MSSVPSSSLDRLSFDERLRHSAVGRYFANIRVALLILFVLTAIGIASFVTLKRELNPEIKIPIVNVFTVFPGADPEDVETLVTVPLEDALQGIEGLDKMTSSSQEGVSAITLEFTSDTNPDEAQTDVQNAVDGVGDLPEDAEDPVVRVVDFQDQPVAQFAVSGTTDDASLERLSFVLEERLKDIPDVTKVNVSGRGDREVLVLVKPEAMRTYNLSEGALGTAVRDAVGSFPGGTVRSDGLSLALSLDPSAESASDLRALPVRVGDRTVTLGQVAEVRERESGDGSIALLGTPERGPSRAISFAVYKSKDAAVDTVVNSIKEEIDRVSRENGGKLSAHFVFDSGFEINLTFNQLFRDFAITTFLVLGLLFLFFGLRPSIGAAATIPFTILVTFTIMQMVGISLNFIALFALLISLGILVDNAIVIVSAFQSYFRTGRFTSLEAALLVWRDFRGVILATTLTTIWAFVPLLLSSGIIGDFIRPIPVVVSATLVVSSLAALFLLLPMLAVAFGGAIPRRVILLRHWTIGLSLVAAAFFVAPAGKLFWPVFITTLLWMASAVTAWAVVRRDGHGFFRKHPRLAAWKDTLAATTDDGLIHFGRLENAYRSLITRILSEKKSRYRTFAMVILLAVFSYALLPAGLVVNEFFPKTDEKQIYVSVELPIGTPLETAESEARALLETVRTAPHSLFTVAEVGATPPTDSTLSSGAASHFILFTVILPDHKERDLTIFEVSDEIERRLADYRKGEVSVTQISGGPPAGADIVINLRGDDLETLNTYAARVKEYLAREPGVTNIKQSINPGPGKVVFVPNEAKLAAAGLSRAQIGLALRGYGSGMTLKSDVHLADEDSRKRDVVLRFSDEREPLLSELGNLSVISPAGQRHTLASLGSFERLPNRTLITREDGKRTLAITAGVEKGYSVSTLNQALGRFADTELGLPEGYGWTTGGVNEENEKSVRSIMLAMVLSAFLIFATMVIQLGSYRKALIVLMVIPLAVSGVFLVFGLTQTPLSFPALIGVLALFGIVVNNSIIMVDKINKNLDLEMSVTEAIVDGSVSRLEPILLTAMTTIVGLIPITLEDPIWRGLGGAIIAGLLLSGVMKLFFIPLIYHAWYADRDRTDGNRLPV